LLVSGFVSTPPQLIIDTVMNSQQASFIFLYFN
jgi:hypothetical protein